MSAPKSTVFTAGSRRASPLASDPGQRSGGFGSLSACRRLAHGGDDRLRERDVAHARAELLALGEAVLDHLPKRRRLFRVLVLLVEEHPGVRGDRVGLGPLRI